ncbi:class I SAM-dependent methyltransferase [Sporichthya sp.]|uniref:class I SAM-dependent methyltransferase n=1 Tax=Sporichthya sp. TaxID=65475 RepID=UPI00183AA02C|nr:class I SAM-dependent methyltransferase [Sporichthya sp.]MBA3741942.1 class I SAM-dependent methyltransferase [Sporichthya sp.]
MKPNATISRLYQDMYAHSALRAWRDAGAVSKADNVIRAHRAAGLPSAPRVIELGCGEGALAAELLRRSFPGSYLGMDISTSGIEEARARAIPGADFRLTAGGHVDLADGCADLAILSHVVEHLEHPRVLLYEAKRIASHVLVEVPLELHWRTPRDYHLDALGHINKYTARSIRHLAQSSGFEVLNQFTTNPGHARFGDASLGRNLSWRVKDIALRTVPLAARTCFTFHETLMLRS